MTKGSELMPEKNPDFITLFWISMATVSGAIGGCGAAAIYGLKGARLIFSNFLAYIFIGSVCGALTYAFGHFVHGDEPRSMLGWAMSVGFGVPLVLAAHNFGARYAFKVFGVEMEIRLKKPEEQKDEHEELTK